MTQPGSLAVTARRQAADLSASVSEGKTAMAFDSKPILGKDGKFKSSVPPDAVRPKPVNVPEKQK
ncbi:MAG: hypothetical protein ABSC47_06500 [Terracidiphilus sp.]|jgi:hypothetical protein